MFYSFKKYGVLCRKRSAITISLNGEPLDEWAIVAWYPWNWVVVLFGGVFVSAVYFLKKIIKRKPQR